MTENRRIVLNIVATYGRSLYALLCGFFTGRWVLVALGDVDYGLYGLVAGLTCFISFFNTVLGSAIGRYYAVAVGAMRSSSDRTAALRECQAWFNVAVSIHTIIPVTLIVIGYPVGCWAICNFLTIPIDRVGDCIWIFRFVCFTCFVGMVSVPFNAMYIAKQYIAELTIYSFVTTTVNIVFLYFMVTHPGVWLVKYGIWTCAISFVPSIIILFRAMIIFPECTLHRSMLFKFDRFKQLGSYASWQFIGMASGLLRAQGMAVVVNKFFGPSVNAAMTVGSTVNLHANTLSGSMFGALSPAITNAYGSGDFGRMRSLVFTMCRFGVLLSLVFAAPLILEMREVLVLWLKHPPQYAMEFAVSYLGLMLLENMTVGHMIAVNASGRIAAYHMAMGSISLLALPIAYFWMRMGGDPVVSVVSIIITVIGYSLLRLMFARKIVGLSIRYWILHVAIPLVVASSLTFTIGYLPHMFMASGVVRLILTTLFCEMSLLPLIWCVLLSKEERRFVVEKFGSKAKRLIGMEK